MELTDSVQSFRSDAPAKKNQCRIPLGITVLSPGHLGTVPYHLSQKMVNFVSGREDVVMGVMEIYVIMS